MGYEPSRCGNHHIGTKLQALQLLVVPVSIVTAVDGNTAYTVEVISESLHSLVDLLRQFPCRAHDDAGDLVLRVSAIGELAQYRQQIGGRLSRSRLRYSEDVASSKYLRYTFFLYWSAVLEAHVVEGVKDSVI